MKTNSILLMAAAAMLSLGACTKAPSTCNSSTDDVYTGVLPAADADGVRYTLLLDYDDDSAGGDYDLVQTYFNNDSTGVVDIASFATEGDFTVGTNTEGKKYIKLSGDSAGEMYFVDGGNSILVMTDASTIPTNTGLSYTLKKAK